MNYITRFLNCRNMLKPHQICGEIPSNSAIYHRAIDIAWPSAMEALLVGLIGSIDTIMVGTIGPEAIAAVGITNQPKFIFLCIIFSLNAGVTTVVARRKGQQDYDGMNRCLRQALMICGLLSLLSSIGGILFAEPMMRFSGAQSDILGDASMYFAIVMGGTLISNMGMTINAAQRGVGNTRVSMVTNLTANGVNLVLNYVLINGKLGFPRLGIKGAAIATVVGGLVSFFISLTTILGNKTILSVSLSDSWKFDRETMGAIWKIWSGALVEQLVSRFGFFVYAKIVASLGTLAFAAHQICMNVVNLSFNLGEGFSAAVSSLVGQSLGEKRPDMARIYVRVTNIMTGSIAAVLTVLLITLQVPIVSLFSRDPQIIQLASPVVALIGSFMILQTITCIYSGALRGAGDARFIAVMSLLCIGIFRPLSAWILCYPMTLGLFGAWISFFLDQCLRFVLVYNRYRKDRWAEIVV